MRTSVCSGVWLRGHAYLHTGHVQPGHVVVQNARLLWCHVSELPCRGVSTPVHTF